jgi:hypothetical protein
MGAPYRFHSICIWQPQVQNDNVNRALREILLGVTDGPHVNQFSIVSALFVEHLAEQAGVSGIIFDQQKHSD